MRAREVGWITFLAGLPLAPFLDRRLDLWHGHAVWAMGWVSTLFALSWWSGMKPTVSNKPLALWLLWTLLWTGWMWKESMLATKVYPLPLLLPLMSVLAVVAFYHAATQMWDGLFLISLLRWMAWASVVVMAYCLLQVLNLDQFLKDLDTHSKSKLVGTIGNPTHLASYLAFTLPLLLLQQGWWWKVMVAVNLCLLAMTSSIGGQVAAGVVLLWWCGWQQRRLLPWVIGGLGIASLVGLGHWQATLNPYGRWQAWATFWPYFLAKPITGWGLGFIMQLSTTITDPASTIWHWRHVHNEFFQLAIEQGVIGLGLLTYALCAVGYWFWRLPKTPLLVALTAILLAASVNSLTSFPLHLWMLSSIILTAYCGVVVLAQDDQTVCAWVQQQNATAEMS